LTVASIQLEVTATEPPAVTVEVSASPPPVVPPLSDAIGYLKIEPSQPISSARVRITLSRSVVSDIDPDSVTVMHWEGYWKQLSTERVGEFTYEFDSGLFWFAIRGWRSPHFIVITPASGENAVQPSSSSCPSTTSAPAAEETTPTVPVFTIFAGICAICIEIMLIIKLSLFGK